jgi:L-fuconolactonase
MSNLDRRTFIGGLAAGMASAAQKYRIVDSHVHVWKHDPKYPFAEGAKVPPEDASVDMLLDLMKTNGVAKTVIIQVIHYKFDNSLVADVLKQYPDTFHGVARVDPLNPGAPDHLSKLVQEQRFRGVRLSPAGNASGDWITGPLMPPLWKRCEQLKVPMTILTPITRIPDIEVLYSKYPDLTLVIDHMADCPVDKPAELEKLIALKRYPKVFVKISHTWSLSRQPYPWLDSQEHVKRLHAAFGPQRLMWGTDWPVSKKDTEYAKTLSVVRDDMKFLNDDDKSWMLSKTVERVWPFPPS